MAAHEYSTRFFDFVDASSGRSAARFLARVELGFAPRSVLDVGCGRGIWLRAWKDRGVAEVVGLDGSYVMAGPLHVAPGELVATDLGRPFDLGRTFDLVQCLEVAEHLPEAAAGALVASLIRHGDVVMFSAATPGQGGEHHLNEQPLRYWVEKFRAAGCAVYDALRPAVSGIAEIEPWYRYNALLFATPRGATRLSRAVRATEIAPGKAPAQYAPLWWRVRCAVVRTLPRPVVDALARAKHAAARRGGG